MLPMAEIDPIIGVICVALISPIGAYLVAARRLSGKIGTSDAEQLWQESKSIRDWSKERLQAQDTEITNLRDRLDSVWKRLREVEDQNIQLSTELTTARKRIAELEGASRDK